MRPRREFSTLTKRLALARSKGFCECARVPQLPTFGRGCGRPLSEGNTFFEHIVCDALDGDNTVDNCAVLTRTCWRLKTDRYDLPVIAKAKRQNDRSFGIKPIAPRPLPGGRSSLVRITMGHGPVNRRTGEPWRFGG